MRAVKSRDTGPEMAVRRLIHSMGYRYRLHLTDLPGKPDLVFSSRRKIVFVHGCWWHGHNCKRGDREPATNRDYWLPKIQRTRVRDAENDARLRAGGWDVLTIWECQIKAAEKLTATLCSFLN